MTNNIRIIRKSKNLTLKDVAARIPRSLHTEYENPITGSYLAQLERAHVSKLSEDTLSRVAKALRVPVALLTKDGLKLEPAKLIMPENA